MKLGSKVLTYCIVFLLCTAVYGQDGFHFGIKGGPTLANQTLNESDRRFLLTYHGSLFVESRDPGDRGALYAQLGMHNRGSSFGRSNIGSSGLQYNFQNLSLQLGARKKVSSGLSVQPYYFVGIRVEYTLGDNMEEMFLRLFNINSNNINNNFSFSLLEPEFVNKINYGLSFGGGFEFSGGEFFTPALEFNISPDVSFQYDRPELNNPPVPVTQIRNLTFEVSLVLKFLREVIYTD